jgi:hypothetical protein
MYGVDHPLDQLREWGFNPSEIGVELIMLATALTAADTRISRGAHSQDGWSREIDLHLPVSDVARWSSQAMLLQTMLRFLTGDRWQLFFRPRPTDAPSLVRPTEKLRMFEPSCVCLFSGGLDSFIGATNLLARRETPMLVSHWWDPNASKHQTNCIEALAARFAPQELHHVRAQIGFDHDTLAQSSREDTLRGRSFLFFALAAATASAVGGVVTVYVPENGLISLNVPLDPLRVGALSTRTTHPFYMARFNELLQGLGIPAQLENPHRHQTKGEMVDSCLEKDFLRTSAKLTMSCSAEGKHRHDRDEARRKGPTLWTLRPMPHTARGSARRVRLGRYRVLARGSACPCGRLVDGDRRAHSGLPVLVGALGGTSRQGTTGHPSARPAVRSSRRSRRL